MKYLLYTSSLDAITASRNIDSIFGYPYYNQNELTQVGNGVFAVGPQYNITLTYSEPITSGTIHYIKINNIAERTLTSASRSLLKTEEELRQSISTGRITTGSSGSR